MSLKNLTAAAANSCNKGSVYDAKKAVLKFKKDHPGVVAQWVKLDKATGEIRPCSEPKSK